MPDLESIRDVRVSEPNGSSEATPDLELIRDVKPSDTNGSSEAKKEASHEPNPEAQREASKIPEMVAITVSYPYPNRTASLPKRKSFDHDYLPYPPYIDPVEFWAQAKEFSLENHSGSRWSDHFIPSNFANTSKAEKVMNVCYPTPLNHAYLDWLLRKVFIAWDVIRKGALAEEGYWHTRASKPIENIGLLSRAFGPLPRENQKAVLTVDAWIEFYKKTSFGAFAGSDSELLHQMSSAYSQTKMFLADADMKSGGFVKNVKLPRKAKVTAKTSLPNGERRASGCSDPAAETNEHRACSEEDSEGDYEDEEYEDEDEDEDEDKDENDEPTCHNGDSDDHPTKQCVTNKVEDKSNGTKDQA